MKPEMDTIYCGDALEVMRSWPDAFVHCCVTSPPYYSLRDYGVEGQIGLEASPEEYVDKMVEAFREVRRVMRGDGVCFVNLGDNYSSGMTNLTNAFNRIVKSGHVFFLDSVSVASPAEGINISPLDKGTAQSIFETLLCPKREDIEKGNHNFPEILDFLASPRNRSGRSSVSDMVGDAATTQMLTQKAKAGFVITTTLNSETESEFAILRPPSTRPRESNNTSLSVKEPAEPRAKVAICWHSTGDSFLRAASGKGVPDIDLVNQPVTLRNGSLAFAGLLGDFQITQAGEKQLALRSIGGGLEFVITDIGHLRFSFSDGSVIPYSTLYTKASRLSSREQAKQEMGIPGRMKIALQEDGWICRSTIIWSKPNPMPESVNGWRWERHRVKVKNLRCDANKINLDRNDQGHQNMGGNPYAEWRDCPGCEKCEGNDGLVLRRGSWRPTKAHEMVFMLTKSERYFCDAEAVKEVGAGRIDRGHGSRGRIGEQGWTGQDQPDSSGSNLRSVWNIATAPFSEAHFACVDADTECLTATGWKRYDSLRIGELIAAYDTERCCSTWTPIKGISSYPVSEQEMVRIVGRGIDQMLTPNHRCVIRRRSGTEDIVLACELRRSHKVLVAAPWQCDTSDFPTRMAALMGWCVTEGYLGEDCVTLYQSGDANPAYCDEIRTLLDAEGATHRKISRERTWRGRQTIAVSWRITGGVAHELLAYCQGKHLPDGFLQWNDAALNALWDALMKGDGHFREAGRQTFVQKDKTLIDQVQALATRLGYATTLRKRSTGTWSLYKTASHTRLLHSESSSLLSRASYTGTVWCPQTAQGTFIARRDGRVFITGNTFPPKLVEPCIKAGTSERGCCPECGAPWVRITKVSYTPHWKGGHRGKAAQGNAKGMSDQSMLPRLQKHDTTLGWRPSCECDAGEPYPCIVLDPFMGAGTVGVVARKHGRHYLGIELNPEYCDMARARIRKETALPLFERAT